MKNGWRMFKSDRGLNSLENEKLDERSFYCLKVFLSNCFKRRYQEKKDKPKSLLFQLAQTVYNPNEIENQTEKDGYIQEFQIDRKKMILTWNACEGLIVFAEEENANDVLVEIQQELEKRELWWCKEAVS